MAEAKKPMSYERVIYLFLSLYRFFTYVLAVALIQARLVGTPTEPDLQTYVILSVVGVYTLLKVFAPLPWQQKEPMTYVVLVGDLLLCVLLLMITNGLDSGFLLYALTPIITAALLFEERIALTAAGLPSLSLLIAHVGASHWSSEFVWIMQGNYLPLLIIYISFCFLIATLAYRINLNIRLRVEMEAVLEERRRIRREIHDGVAQALSYLNLKASLVRDSLSSQNTNQALTGLEDIQKVVKDTYEEIRQSIDSLSQRSVSPLIPALTEYVHEFGERNSIETEFDSPQSMPGLSPRSEFQLLRIAHEALTNVRKHALATEVWVKLENTPQEIAMTVKDNGQGFSFTDYQQNSSGHEGLNIMKERVESLGGIFTVVTSPGQGTEIRANIPVEKVRL